MERYAILACEAMYGGSNGIYTTRIFEGSRHDAEELATQLSLDVMDSYFFFYDEFSEAAREQGYEENSDEFDDYVISCYEENIEYRIGKIRSDVTLTSNELEELLENDWEEFFEKYCIL